MGSWRVREKDEVDMAEGEERWAMVLWVGVRVCVCDEGVRVCEGWVKGLVGEPKRAEL